MLHLWVLLMVFQKIWYNVMQPSQILKVKDDQGVKTIPKLG